MLMPSSSASWRISTWQSTPSSLGCVFLRMGVRACPIPGFNLMPSREQRHALTNGLPNRAITCRVASEETAAHHFMTMHNVESASHPSLLMSAGACGQRYKF